MAELTEKIVFNVRHCTDVKSIYLVWKNPLQGYDYWLFDGYREGSLQVEQGEQFSAGGGRRREYISKVAYPRIIIRAGGLSETEAEGIKYLANSNEVYIEKPTGELVPVTVVTGSLVQINDQAETIDIELEIELAAINSLSN